MPDDEVIGLHKDPNQACLYIIAQDAFMVATAGARTSKWYATVRSWVVVACDLVCRLG